MEMEIALSDGPFSSAAASYLGAMLPRPLPWLFYSARVTEPEQRLEGSGVFITQSDVIFLFSTLPLALPSTDPRDFCAHPLFLHILYVSYVLWGCREYLGDLVFLEAYTFV